MPRALTGELRECEMCVNVIKCNKNTRPEKHFGLNDISFYKCRLCCEMSIPKLKSLWWGLLIADLFLIFVSKRVLCFCWRHCHNTVNQACSDKHPFQCIQQGFSNLSIQNGVGRPNVSTVLITFNTLRPPGRKGPHFADYILKRIFVKELHEFRLKFHWSLFLGVQWQICQH